MKQNKEAWILKKIQNILSDNTNETVDYITRILKRKRMGGKKQSSHESVPLAAGVSEQLSEHKYKQWF